ncbi:MAG: MATE family efflux transporter [Rhodobacteraceae bacterium]|nr:MATE family efflux transporter [Paracoccaceae bacterium]
MAEEKITHKRVLKVALPIVLSNATIPILGAVDTGVIGQMGLAAPIGAVGIGAVILAALYWIFGFLRMGTTGMVAQARGAGDGDEVSALLMRGLMIGGAAGVIILLLQIPVFWAGFWLSPASPEVEELAQQYMAIRIWGAPAAISIYALTGWLIAMERTRTVLVLQLWMNGLNVVLDVWFVLGLGFGVEGVAVATLIAEWSGLMLGLFLCRSAISAGQWRRWARIFDPVRLRQMAVVNSDIMIRSVLLQASFMTFLFLGAGLGDVTLAANQIMLQFVSITAYALDGFAFSAEALVGGALGAKNRAALRRAAILSSIWALLGALLLMGVFALFGPALIFVMTTAEPVREDALLYLWWMVAFPLFGLPGWMLDGIFIGATRTREMRLAMLQSTAAYVVFLAILVPTMGNHGLWLSLTLFSIVRALTLWRYYPALEASAGQKV